MIAVSKVRNWPMYNMAQTSEKTLALKLLSDAVDSLGIPRVYSGRGRPSLAMDDVLKAMVIKVFNNWSARRSISDIKLAKGMGYLQSTPHFNIICKYMRSKEMAPYLHRLYKTLALPLAPVESVFAIDGTGFSTFKKHWVEYRIIHREWKQFKKLHAICGVHTNIITHAQVSEGKKHDSPFFEELVRGSAENFNIKEICGDAAYLSKNNCEISMDIGATPYILPKVGVRSLARGSLAWRKMIRNWINNKEVFMKHYHMRSNVESTFSMMKRKFLPYLRSKSEQGQYNELLCKVVAHNLSVLTNSIFEVGGIETKFSA